MKKRKLGIIGGSGLYKMDGFEKTLWKKINTPWGSPSDQILKTKYNNKEVYFLPRHGRGHYISPSNISPNTSSKSSLSFLKFFITLAGAVGSSEKAIPT